MQMLILLLPLLLLPAVSQEEIIDAALNLSAVGGYSDVLCDGNRGEFEHLVRSDRNVG